ncbi:hypothetical protein YB2330_003908 [Saitoella coloradoensis]
MSIEGKHHDIYPAIDPSNPSSGLANAAEGRTVIITGAGRGIGRSIALNYAKAKAKIIVLAARTASQLTEVAEEIKKINDGIKILEVETDVTDASSVTNLIEKAVDESGKEALYTLFNNAGILEPNLTIAESDPDTWFKTWEINLKSTYLPTHYLLPHLSPNTPKPHYIINTSSIGSRGTRAGFSAYQPSKTAINRFTAFLDTEHHSTHNLITFAVHPGGVMTELARESMPKDTWGLLCDTPELMGGFGVWVGSGACDWARGRYLECNWDVEDIASKRGEVEGGSEWGRTIVVV